MAALDSTYRAHTHIYIYVNCISICILAIALHLQFQSYLISWLCAQDRVFLGSVYWVWHSCSYWSYLAVSIDLTEKTWTDSSCEACSQAIVSLWRAYKSIFCASVGTTSWMNADMWSGASALTTDLYRATHGNEPWPLPGFILTFTILKKNRNPPVSRLTFISRLFCKFGFSPTFVKECWCDSEAQVVTSHHGEWDETFKMWCIKLVEFLNDIFRA